MERSSCIRPSAHGAYSFMCRSLNMYVVPRGNRVVTSTKGKVEERKLAMENERADSFSDDADERRDSRDERRLRDRDEERVGRASTDRKSRRTRSRTRSRSRSRSRSPDRRDRSRKKIRKKHESSDSDSPISPSSSAASSDHSSSSGESSDGETHKREKRRKKEHKKRSSRRSDKDSKEKKSKKRKKRHRSSRKDRDEDDNSEAEKKRRLLKEAKKLLKKHKQTEESNAREIEASGRKVDKISADDYFLKSSEFATWLKEERGVYFSDLSSKETHEFFEAFVDKWNAARLPPKYYDGIQQAPRTNHNWAIKRGTEDVVDKEEDYALAKQRDKYERKKFQKEYEANLDDIVPKAAVGRERQMEIKAIRREQARAREESPPELMKERDIMGGGDDFQQRLAREKARREKKQAEKMAAYSEKSSVFQEKESATMEQFKTLVNVAGGKITIAKRQ
ncbi:unnamed protein product [Calypogeia fissa]